MKTTTENEQQFLMELGDLMKRYGLTIEQRTSFDSSHYSEDWAFEGKDFELDLCDVADWLEGEGRTPPTISE